MFSSGCTCSEFIGERGLREITENSGLRGEGESGLREIFEGFGLRDNVGLGLVISDNGVIATTGTGFFRGCMQKAQKVLQNPEDQELEASQLEVT